MGLSKIPKGPLREGFTTGTSATAAAKAALWAIINQNALQEVSVSLPIDKTLTIPIHYCDFTSEWAKCSIIKDAGDDPDVTNKAEIGCEITLIQEKGAVHFSAGEGVGIVTLPGLQLEVGEPAINPVPRQMICAAMRKLLHDSNWNLGVHVKVFVINGVQLAKRTLNERVGIMNGLSILGTTGIVKPYSSASYIASIEQGVDVAIANGIDELVINSGARSEKYLRALFPTFEEQAFIHYGNWIGETLRKISSSSIRKINIGIMLGKAAKLAAGQLDTHSCVSSWDKKFIVALAKKSGYSLTQQEAVHQLNMAGRLPEVFPFEPNEIFYQQLLACCYQQSKSILNQIKLDLFLIDKNGVFIKYQQL